MKILQRNINHNSEKINSLNYAYNIFIDEQESLTLDNKLKSIDIDITKNIENIKLNNNAIVNHTTNNQNPHNVTKTQIGLSNVDNTADAVKNVLSASKLTNARNITIGNSNKLFNGTGDLNYSLAEIGASDINHKHNLSSTSEAGFMRALSNNTSHFMRGDGTWVTPPDTKYGVANTTTLGLVKSGGDITVNSSGIVSVNDNSHKHSDSTITSLSSSKLVGQIPIELIPKAALERLITVENKTARLALTNDRVQTGDTVQEIDTGVMYVVIDDTKLNSEAGYKAYTAASASSVPWSGITGKPSSFVPSSHTHTKNQVGLANVDNTADSVKNVLSATKLTTARNITIGNSTKSFNGTANVSYSLSEIGAAATSHSHSNYLPLAGGTMTGRLTANGKIIVPSTGSTWISGKTLTNAAITFGEVKNSVDYYPLLSLENWKGNVVNIGSYANTFKILGYLKGRSENGYDWETSWHTDSGEVYHSSNITAKQFIGPLNGNASTATKLATARNITIGSSTKAFDGSGNVSYSLSEIGAAAISHSHSNYLPLAGGTMTGKLTANGRIKTSLVGGSWLNSKTTSNAGIDFGSFPNNGTYYPFFAGTSMSGHTISVGGIANSFNIVGILSDTTENRLQWRTYWDINTGNIYHSNNITAAFTGPLNGNASTATKLATARNITIGSSTKAFDGSANISFSLSEIGAAASSHTHTKSQVGLGNVDNTADSTKNVLSATKLTTARNITIGSSTKSFNGTANVSYTLSEIGAAASSHTHTKAQVGLGNVDNTADSAKNVLSASKLTTARNITIGNTTKTFDGSSDIEFTLSEVGANSSDHTHTKAQVGLGNVDNTADASKNVLSATKLTTARNITIGSSTKSFNGTANVSYSLSEIGAAASSHTHTKAQVGLGNVDNTADASKNVLSATKLTTARNITIGSSTKSFNGTADMNYTLSEIGAASSSHTHNSLEAESLANQTISLNTLNLANEGAIIRYYYCPTNGTGANITGRPDDTKKYAFLLKVEKLRNSSSSDYVTKQTYIDYSTTCTYERYCNCGTWSAWYKVYTSKDKPTLSELGAAASSHSHSNYLPLNGGTMTGRLMANGKIIVPSNGSSWISGKTLSNASLSISGKVSASSYHPFFAFQSNSDHVFNFGALGDGFYINGYKSTRTENGTDWRTCWDISTGNISHNATITAAQFTGPLSGNASTATKLSTARNITIGANTKSFDGSANISFSLSEIGAAASSHTHTKAQVGLSNVDNTADSAKNVLSATKLTTARNITIGSSTKSFNGTANVSYSLSEIGAASSSHTHNSLEAESLAGKTISLDTLTLPTGIPSVKYYDCYSNGDGANITGRPIDSLKYSFILKVESIRYISETDYVTKQTFIDVRCITYERYCKSGNWTAWSKVYNSSDLSAADKSELTNLVLNGDGKLGKTIGWENHTFSTDAPLGAYGSFIDGLSDRIYVNFNQDEVYDLSFYLKNKSGNTGIDYFAMIPYDSERNYIEWYHVAKTGLTKLTKDLNNGDTVIYCEDLSKWSKTNADTYNYWRHIGFHDYTNKNGYTYPPGTYTRNIYLEAFANGSSINTTNNTLTLKKAWSGGTKKAGTYIAQHNSGSSRIYFGLVGKVPPAEWTKYEIKSISKSADIRLPYTASIRFYMLNKKAMISNLVFKRQAATLSDIDKKINNIDIGGRNYIIYGRITSHNPHNVVDGRSINYIKTTWKSSYTGNTFTLRVDGFIPPKGIWTVSGRIKVNGSIPTSKYFTSSANTYGSLVTKCDYDTTTGRFVITQTYPGTSAWILHCPTTRSSGSSDVVELFDLKFEKGNKATDWSLSPEDLDNNISLIRPNLLSGTKDWKYGKKDGTIQSDKYYNLSVLYYKNTTSSASYVDIALWSGLSVKASTEYTLSFYAKGTGKIISYFHPNNVQIGYSNKGITTTSQDGSIQHTLTSGWEKYVITWKTLSTISGNKNVLPVRTYKGTEVWVCGVKFEEGNGATAWCESSSETAIPKYSVATTTSNGLMSSNDKSKLDMFGNGYVTAGFVPEPGSTNTLGEWVTCEGLGNLASGRCSHAEGINTTASGNYSHAEGTDTTASGTYSHAEGLKTTASRNSSHAEGYSTISSGDYSHAEGLKTTASGHSSHAEGSGTKALGVYSHAEGIQTNANGYASHSEGDKTTANESSSHAEGSNTTASGTSSHAEGLSTTASGEGSHAEGGDTIASGLNSHAEGGLSYSDGDYSHAEGHEAKAIGYASHAEGGVRYLLQGVNRYMIEDKFASSGGEEIISMTVSYTVETNTSTQQKNYEVYAPAAVGTASHAEGVVSVASGIGAHSEGYLTVASGDYSHAEGSMAYAEGDYSHAEGWGYVWGNNANGVASHVEGFQTTARGEASHAEGCDTVASGDYSHAEGYHTFAEGSYSHSAGYYTIADNDCQTVIGKHNKTGLTLSLFTIGNGSYSPTTATSNRANAFRVNSDGYAYGNSFNTSGADYAEFFEWKDQNIQDEDRCGLFVTLDGEYIRIANSNDKYILGVVSANPSVLGDAYNGDNWNGIYEKDVFGRIQYHTVHIEEEKDENGVIIMEARDEVQPIISKNYNNQKAYYSREERTEWEPIGLLGKLIIIDDGTCEVNGYCKVADGGIGTKDDSETGYRVLSRLDENHIKILFR